MYVCYHIVFLLFTVLFIKTDLLKLKILFWLIFLLLFMLFLFDFCHLIFVATYISTHFITVMSSSGSEDFYYFFWIIFLCFCIWNARTVVWQSHTHLFLVVSKKVHKWLNLYLKTNVNQFCKYCTYILI